MSAKSDRESIYKKYLRSKQFAEVKKIVLERQGGICPICGDPIDDENKGTCHHRRYLWAGFGGEKEATCCVYIHTYEHQAIHRHKKSYSVYSVYADRNEPDPENHSELAEAIRKERNEREEKK